ncbi:MAG: glutathione S-transferase family protein [Actinomycetia bacterium]|nr:glutathione S-transferase family protein [Actinomycetes bacterium]
MADLVLYDHPVSSNCLKVRFLLAELGLDAERRHMPFTRPRPSHYVELNPFGGLPSLIDGSVMLAESNAILRYLARREQRDDLYPSEPGAAAGVDWALDAWATNVRPALAPAESVALMETGNWDEGGGRWEDADQDRLGQALEQAAAALERFEAFCADNGTVLGEFTIADCCVAPVLWRWKRLPLGFDSFPKTALLQGRASNRPSFLAAEPVA